MSLLIHKISALFDPYTLNMEYTKHIENHVALAALLHYLRQLDEGKMLEFEFILPKYLLPDYAQNINIESIVGIVQELSKSPLSAIPDLPPNPAELMVMKEPIDLSDYEKNSYIIETKKYKEKWFRRVTKHPSLKEGSDGIILFNHNGLDLLKMADYFDSNYVVTDNQILHNLKKRLALDGINIVTYREFVNELAIFLRGYNVFFNPYHTVQPLGMTTFYSMTDLSHSRLKLLHYKLSAMFSNKTQAMEYIVAVIYRRYTWLRYAADMTSFYSQQILLSCNPQSNMEYNLPMSYHIQQFYFQFSAIIDNLAWILNYIYDLGYSEDTNPDDCRFGSKKFKEKLTKKNSSIAGVIYSNKNSEFRKRVMNVMRNPSAHQHALMKGTLIDSNGDILAHDFTYVRTRMGDYVIRNINDVMKDDQKCIIDFLLEICHYYGV